jgi:hypothetical protein
VNCLKKPDSSSVLIEIVSDDDAAGGTITIIFGCKNLVCEAQCKTCFAAS